MKPTKNRVYCLDCGRPKMLFKEEKQALLFMQYNAAEIEEETGFRPIRAYWCKFCVGWHITSRKVAFVTPNEAKLDKYHEAMISIKNVTPVVGQGKIDENRAALEEQLKDLGSRQKVGLLSEKIEQLKKLIEDIRPHITHADKDKLKALRQNLDLLYVTRKRYKF